MARYGGDEFVLLCTPLHETENVHLIGERALEAVSAPVDCVPAELHVRASVGAVVSSDPGADPERLIEEADTAMYAAKRAGGDRLVIFGSDLDHPFD